MRVLFVYHRPLRPELGAARPQFELGRIWGSGGIEVSTFDSRDAFPELAGGRWAGGRRAERVRRLLLPSFPRRLAAFIERRGSDFDLIEGHPGNLPFAKADLGYTGALVVRSVGLFAFSRYVEPRPLSLRLRPSTLLAWLEARRCGGREVDLARSFASADLINTCNRDEAEFIRGQLRVTCPVMVEPLGVGAADLRALAAEALAPADRSRQHRVAFIGSWGRRKGSADWGEIIRRLDRASSRPVHYRFLGTVFGEGRVRADLGSVDHRRIEVVPAYPNGELPRLLADATVGAFPSYLEGFGIGLLEMLGAGLPCVAYDVPGPREMLAPKAGAGALVPPGDIGAFVRRLGQFLEAPAAEYARASERSRKVAEPFNWEAIGARTAEVYRRLAGDVRRSKEGSRPHSVTAGRPSSSGG